MKSIKTPALDARQRRLERERERKRLQSASRSADYRRRKHEPEAAALLTTRACECEIILRSMVAERFNRRAAAQTLRALSELAHALASEVENA